MNVKRYTCIVLCFAIFSCQSANNIEQKAGHTGKTITRTEMGEAWPLTIESITLYCFDEVAIIGTSPDGKTYAINNVAHSHMKLKRVDTQPIHDVLKAGKDAEPLIEMGKKLCH